MNLFAAFHAEMLSRGIYLASSGYEAGFLSNAHTETDIAKTADAVEASIKNVL